MLRNRNRNRDFMGYEPPMPQHQPAPSSLDSQTERLLDLSETVGQLGGQNDLLNEDNRRLEDENADLKKRNTELSEKVRGYESRAERAEAGYKSGAQLVAEAEEAILEIKAKAKAK